MNGEWIIVHPTDCFTLLPVYECSVCKNTCDGYDPDPICYYCGSKNKVNNKKSIVRPLIIIKDTKEINKDVINIRSVFEHCMDCGYYGWDMPQCRECSVENNYKHFVRKYNDNE